jgi:hypothetical protein
MKQRLLAILAGSAILAVASPALADITILTDPPFPGNPDENVLLTDGDTAMVLSGFTNKTNTEVLFTGQELLVMPANGQARVEGADGGLDWLQITLANPNLGFSAFEFNVDADADGFATLFFYDQFNTPFGGNYAVSGSGQNFFNAVASNNEVITKVLLSTTVSAALDFSDVQQVRISPVPLGGQPDPHGIVPEPASWTLMILGFGSVGSLLRARRRHGWISAV